MTIELQEERLISLDYDAIDIHSMQKLSHDMVNAKEYG